MPSSVLIALGASVFWANVIAFVAKVAISYAISAQLGKKP